MSNLSGLICSVYRNSGSDCTANGITSRYDEVLVLDIEKDRDIGPFSVEDAERLGIPVVFIHHREYLNAPCIMELDYKKPGFCSPMAGGNFVYTSDSRFPYKFPISVHDRYEG